MYLTSPLCCHRHACAALAVQRGTSSEVRRPTSHLLRKLLTHYQMGQTTHLPSPHPLQNPNHSICLASEGSWPFPRLVPPLSGALIFFKPQFQRAFWTGRSSCGETPAVRMRQEKHADEVTPCIMWAASVARRLLCSVSRHLRKVRLPGSIHRDATSKSNAAAQKKMRWEELNGLSAGDKL